MDSKFLTHFLQSRIVKLFPVIGDDRIWDFKLANDVSLDKVHAFCLSDCGEWFCLYLLGEIINRHNGELACTRALGSGPIKSIPYFQMTRD